MRPVKLDYISHIPHRSQRFNGLIVLIVYFCLFIFASCSSENSATKPSNQNNQSDTQTVETVNQVKKRIVFFGNSLTAGYGLKEEEAFPALIQNILDSLNLPYISVNAGLSGETTAGGERRIDWVLKQEMDVFFLELGGNDMLRGTGVETTESNLRGIIEKVRQKHPEIKIILAGMLAPPNMGKDYTDAFASIYPRLAEELNLTLIPFFLEGVGGNPNLNQADGIHPNIAGQKVVAQTVWKYLFPLLEK